MLNTESSMDVDDVIEFKYLGDDLSDGLFGWVIIAINISATYDSNYNFVETADELVNKIKGIVTVNRE